MSVIPQTPRASVPCKGFVRGPLRSPDPSYTHAPLNHKSWIRPWYLSGISFHLKIQGLSDLTDNFIIKKMLGGYDKLNKRCDIRKPITLDILIQLSDALVHICSSKYQVLMFKIAFVLVFSAFLRVGEITVTQYRNDKIYNIGVLTVNILLMWQGLETWKRRSLASLFIRFVPNHLNSIFTVNTSILYLSCNKMF